MTLLTTLLNIVLPIFFVVGAGYLLGRLLEVDVRSLSRVVLYVFSPAIVFSSLIDSTLTAADFTAILAFVVLSTAAMGALSWGAARLFHFDGALTYGLILTQVSLNTGNYGLPVNLFAYGQAGLERAVIFFVGTAVLTNTVAVYFASRGRAGVRESVANVFKLPLLYAMVLAFVIKFAGWSLPTALTRPVELAADGAIPLMLVMLGIQLSQSAFVEELPAVGVATALRLLVAAAVAVVLATLLGLEGLTRRVTITQASMPTGVMSIVLSIEFGAQPRFVTSVVFATTLVSLVSLTVLLTFLL